MLDVGYLDISKVVASAAGVANVELSAGLALVAESSQTIVAVTILFVSVHSALSDHVSVLSHHYEASNHSERNEPHEAEVIVLGFLFFDKYLFFGTELALEVFELVASEASSTHFYKPVSLIIFTVKLAGV